MFDVLSSLDVVEGSEVLDLFAGSGALGIEALSRGAASVTFVESDRDTAAAIESNLTALGLGGPGVASVVRADALAWCTANRRRFDLVLCDPPYRFEDWPRLLEVLPADLAMLESSRPVQLSGGFRSRRSYRYGTTLVTVVARGGAASEAPS
jgi:16S rRNA (guanine966-N2)-methyltransferase